MISTEAASSDWDSGERGRPARSVWRPAKHIPPLFILKLHAQANTQKAGRETRPAATETVALPKTGKRLTLIPRRRIPSSRQGY